MDLQNLIDSARSHWEIIGVKDHEPRFNGTKTQWEEKIQKLLDQRMAALAIIRQMGVDYSNCKILAHLGTIEDIPMLIIAKGRPRPKYGYEHTSRNEIIHPVIAEAIDSIMDNTDDAPTIYTMANLLNTKDPELLVTGIIFLAKYRERYRNIEKVPSMLLNWIDAEEKFNRLDNDLGYFYFSTINYNDLLPALLEFLSVIPKDHVIKLIQDTFFKLFNQSSGIFVSEILEMYASAYAELNRKHYIDTLTKIATSIDITDNSRILAYNLLLYFKKDKRRVVYASQSNFLPSYAPEVSDYLLNSLADTSIFVKLIHALFDTKIRTKRSQLEQPFISHPLIEQEAVQDVLSHYLSSGSISQQKYAIDFSWRLTRNEDLRKPIVILLSDALESDEIPSRLVAYVENAIQNIEANEKDPWFVPDIEIRF